MKIIISGAARGIGKAIAESFAAEGHQLFLCARNNKTLDAAAAEITKNFSGSRIETMAADLSVKQEADDFGDWCLRAGTPDILINNAGGYTPGNIISEEEGTLEKMLGNNLFSAYHLTRRVVQQMIENGGGHIFNICSIAALQAYEGGGSYSISKFAMNGFSKNLRQELKPHKIKVTTVYPGAVFTDSWAGFDNSGRRIMEAKDIAAMILAATKLSPQAVPEEIILRPQLGDL